MHSTLVTVTNYGDSTYKQVTGGEMCGQRKKEREISTYSHQMTFC